MLSSEKYQFIKTIICYVFIIFCGFILSHLVTIPELNREFDSINLVRSDRIYSFLIAILLGGIYSVKISKRAFMEFVIQFLAVISLLYFILLSRSLNDPNFDVSNFKDNELIPVDYLILIFCILLTGCMAKRFKWLEKYNLYSYVDRHLLYAVFLTPIIFSHSQVVAFINSTVKFDLMDLFNIYCLLIIVLYCSSKGVHSVFKNKVSIYTAFMTSLVMAIIFNGTIQEGIKQQEALLEKYIFPGATLYQIIVLFFIFLTVYLLFNKFFIATLVNLLFGISLSLVNSLKFEMRSEPVLLSDFIWLGEIRFIASFIDGKTLFTFFLVVLSIFTIYIGFHRYILSGRIVLPLAKRLLLLFIPMSFFIGTFSIFKAKTASKIIEGIPVISTLNNLNDISWFGFSTEARYKSLMYVWTKQLTDSVIDKPKKYSKQDIEKLVNKYQERAQEINKTRTELISNQTVIYILSESLADPRRIEGVEVSENVLENIERIKASTTSGLMKSDGYGGGTANMEFQSLTGLPLYNFSPSVSVMMTEIFPQLKVVPSISSQFSNGERIVIHPLNATYYNRKSFYQSLNFDKLLFLRESDETLENVEYLGLNVSDSTTYDNVLRIIDSSKNQFFSVITMQNHSPWTIEEPETITAVGQGFLDEQQNNLSSYVKLLDATDHATNEFLNQLKKIDKKITVVFYGDHLPGFYPSEKFINNPESQYLTDYFIWSNYETSKLDYPLINSSDFTAELLEHTNSKVTPYQALLTDVLKNASVDKGELTDLQQAILDDLKVVQYDLTIGKGYLKDSHQFFELE